MAERNKEDIRRWDEINDYIDSVYSDRDLFSVLKHIAVDAQRKKRERKTKGNFDNFISAEKTNYLPFDTKEALDRIDVIADMFKMSKAEKSKFTSKIIDQVKMAIKRFDQPFVSPSQAVKYKNDISKAPCDNGRQSAVNVAIVFSITSIEDKDKLNLINDLSYCRWLPDSNKIKVPKVVGKRSVSFNHIKDISNCLVYNRLSKTITGDIRNSPVRNTLLHIRIDRLD